MTHQKHFRTVMRGGKSERVPIVIRLNLCHNAGVADGDLPASVKGLSIREIERKLGIAHSARYGKFLTRIFDGAEVVEYAEDNALRTTFSFAGRTLTQRLARTDDQVRYGMEEQIVEPLLKGPEDYETMARAWEKMRWGFDLQGFEEFSAGFGQDALPIIVLGPCPTQYTMIYYAGYEQFYYHLMDFPEQVEALIRVMERRYEEVWQAVAKTSCELVLHGAHWHSDMTPKPLFRKHFIPYYQRFSHAMHAAGKRFAAHCDADLSKLLEEVPQTGLDVADCFVTAPMAPLTLKQARQAWGDRIVLWGGLPATILQPSCPRAEFRAFMDEFCEEVSHGKGVIAAVSDNVMPGADYERIEEMVERIKAVQVR